MLVKAPKILQILPIFFACSTDPPTRKSVNPSAHLSFFLPDNWSCFRYLISHVLIQNFEFQILQNHLQALWSAIIRQACVFQSRHSLYLIPYPLFEFLQCSHVFNLLCLSPAKNWTHVFSELLRAPSAYTHAGCYILSPHLLFQNHFRSPGYQRSSTGEDRLHWISYGCVRFCIANDGQATLSTAYSSPVDK